MSNPLPAEIRQVQEMALANPGTEGLAIALLVLLEKAPDSSIIVEALAPLDPAQFTNDEFRDRVAALLQNCDAPELLARWSKQKAAELDASNVISLAAQTGRESHSQVRRPQFSFDDIGGLENVKAQVRRKIINPF